MPLLRPEHLTEADYSRRLAAADIDLCDLSACRACLVAELGFEPDTDWLSIRTRAFDIRAADLRGEALAMLQGERVAFERVAEITAERIARLQAREAASTTVLKG